MPEQNEPAKAALTAPYGTEDVYARLAAYFRLSAERTRLEAALRSRTRQRDAARVEAAKLRRLHGLYAAPVYIGEED